MNEEKKVKIFYTWDRFNYSLLLFFAISLIIAGFYLATHTHNIYILLLSFTGFYLLVLIFLDHEVKDET